MTFLLRGHSGNSCGSANCSLPSVPTPRDTAGTQDTPGIDANRCCHAQTSPRRPPGRIGGTAGMAVKPSRAGRSGTPWNLACRATSLTRLTHRIEHLVRRAPQPHDSARLGVLASALALPRPWRRPAPQPRRARALPLQLRPTAQGVAVRARNPDASHAGWSGQHPIGLERHLHSAPCHAACVCGGRRSLRSRVAICNSVSQVFYEGNLKVAADALKDPQWHAERTLEPLSEFGTRSVCIRPVSQEARAFFEKL